MEDLLEQKDKEINSLKEKYKTIYPKNLLNKNNDKKKEIKILEEKLKEKEKKLKEYEEKLKLIKEENIKKISEIQNLKKRINNLEKGNNKNINTNNINVPLKETKNNENKNNSQSNQNNNNKNGNKDLIEKINSQNQLISNLQKEKESLKTIYDKNIASLNNQIESIKIENNNLKTELKESQSQNKDLKINIKEKEERIKSLENEIKLKEIEEMRLTKGKIKESGMFDNLKESELGDINEFDKLGNSQDDTKKENEKLKDEIMLLQKNLELKEYEQKNMVSKEEYDKILNENNNLKDELNELKNKDEQNEINILKQSVMSYNWNEPNS